MIDWERVKTLQEEVGAEDFDEVIELFFAEVEGVIDGLPESADAKTVAENLHFLKGAALNLGFLELSNHCQENERSARESDAETLSFGEVGAIYRASKSAFVESLPNLSSL